MNTCPETITILINERDHFQASGPGSEAKKAEAALSSSMTWRSVDSCQGCRMTAQMLEKAGIPFQVVDLSQWPDLIEQFRAEGLIQAPVVEHKGERTAGFRPDRIRSIVSSMNSPGPKAIHNAGQQGADASHVPEAVPQQHGRIR